MLFSFSFAAVTSPIIQNDIVIWKNNDGIPKLRWIQSCFQRIQQSNDSDHTARIVHLLRPLYLFGELRLHVVFDSCFDFGPFFIIFPTHHLLYVEEFLPLFYFIASGTVLHCIFSHVQLTRCSRFNVQHPPQIQQLVVILPSFRGQMGFVQRVPPKSHRRCI